VAKFDFFATTCSEIKRWNHKGRNHCKYCIRFAGKVPVPFDIPMISKSIGIPNPVQIVLLQELEHFNKLVSYMDKCLKELQRALKGEIGMSSDLDAIASSLFNGDVPPQWKKILPSDKKAAGILDDMVHCTLEAIRAVGPKWSTHCSLAFRSSYP